MFRYIGLTWDKAVPQHSAAALRLRQALQSQPGWQPVLQRPGLHVFATGTSSKANGAHLLHVDRGVILGKLFRRSNLDHRAGAAITLRPHEEDRILRTLGRELVEQYWGRYVAFLEDAAGRVVALRDPSGALPCLRMSHHGVTIVFSWLEDVLSIMQSVPFPTVNWSGLAAHILLTRLGGHDTALDGVEAILPGEAATLVPGADPPRLLWNAVHIAGDPMHIEPANATQSLRRTVRSCAQSWASCHEGILLRLSGGVDSSILLSCLAPDSTPSLVTCVNYHSPGADGDERQYARLAAERASRRLIERARSTEVRLERVLDIARTPEPGNPVGHLSAAGMDSMLASEFGASAMFTGAGGDQLFFELRSCWPAADYLRLRGPGPGFLSASMDAARLGKVSVWAALRQAVVHRFKAVDPWRDAGKYLSLVRREALPDATQLERFVHPALLPGHGLPVGKLHQTVQLLHPVDYYDPYEREAAPELVNPLMSQPLIELCLRLPTYVLTHGGRGRALARQAFAADLPTEIANRRSKGGLDEHVRLLLRRNLEFVRSLLLDGDLVRRGILDRAKVEEALSGRPTTLAAHMVEIHTYIGIEAWLQCWSRRPASTAHHHTQAS